MIRWIEIFLFFGAFLFVVLIMPFAIRILQKRQIGQFVREEGPTSHQIKKGTPTMGGVLCIMVVILLGSVRLLNVHAPLRDWLPLYMMTFYGIIGFLDDYRKTILRSPYGLKAREDLFLQILFSIPLILWVLQSGSIYVTSWITFGFELFVVLAVVNSVNLTDGIDGLLGSVSIPVFAFFALVLYQQGHWNAALFSLLIMATLLGFLLYNAHPAKIFMGNVGSFAIGGTIAGLAVLSNTELYLPLLGFIFVAEAFSVILQVTWFKISKRKWGKGKRIFKMSPLHHHFELLGYSETQIVASFTVIQILLCIVSALIYFL